MSCLPFHQERTFFQERDGQIILPVDFMEMLDLYSDSDDWSDSDDL